MRFFAVQGSEKTSLIEENCANRQQTSQNKKYKKNFSSVLHARRIEVLPFVSHVYGCVCEFFNIIIVINLRGDDFDLRIF